MLLMSIAVVVVVVVVVIVILRSSRRLLRGSFGRRGPGAAGVLGHIYSRMDKPTRSDSYPNSIRLSSTQ